MFSMLIGKLTFGNWLSNILVNKLKVCKDQSGLVVTNVRVQWKFSVCSYCQERTSFEKDLGVSDWHPQRIISSFRALVKDAAAAE